MLCMNCRWFVHEDDGAQMDEGTCRRRPPTACYDPESGWAHTVWPHVDFADWCGEFEAQAPKGRGIDEWR